MKEPLVPGLRVIASLQRPGKMSLKEKNHLERIFSLFFTVFFCPGESKHTTHPHEVIRIAMDPKSVCSYKGGEWKDPDSVDWKETQERGRRCLSIRQQHVDEECWECVHTYVSTLSSINYVYITLICFYNTSLMGNASALCYVHRLWILETRVCISFA